MAAATAAFLLLLAVLSRSEGKLENGLSHKPPLGFNTWNYFYCDINEGVVRSAADKLVSLGLVEAGYTYLNLDDCWQSPQRTPDGRLQAHPTKFPSGLSALGDYIHSKGLKYGIYSDAGSKTCAGYPGSRHYEEVDAATFASWGVDYLKYDNCYAEDVDIVERYTDMRDALAKTGRPIYYSMCNWGRTSPWQWAQEVGNSWRTYQDIFPTWASVLRSLDNGAAGLGQFAGPGGWNDPDMLEVGVGRLTLAQQRSHFALWCLVKSPLLIGANLEQISADSLAILKSKEVIAINQDDLGVAGDIIWKSRSAEVWAAPLVNNQRAVVLFNRHRTFFPKTIRVTFAQLGYTNEAATGSSSGFKAVVRDLYAEKDLGVFEDGFFEAAVASYDSIVIKITPISTGELHQQQQDAGSSTTTTAATTAALPVSAANSQAASNASVGLAGHSAPAAPPAAPASTSVVVVESRMLSTTWRPWSDPAAAALQARMRAASQNVRKWDDRRGAVVSFVSNHVYASAFMAAAVLGAVVVGVVQWRLRVSRRSSTSSRDGFGSNLKTAFGVAASLPYKAVPRSEFSGSSDNSSRSSGDSWSSEPSYSAGSGSSSRSDSSSLGSPVAGVWQCELPPRRASAGSDAAV